MNCSFFKGNKPKHLYEVGGGAFKLAFYINERNPDGNYLHITTPSDVFEQKLRGYPFGYLLAAAQQGEMSELEAYCLLLYRVSEEISQDAGFANDIIKALNKRDKRLMKQAENRAKTVTSEQEQVAQAFMEEIIAETSMGKRELKSKRKADRELMQEILNKNEDE